MNRRHTRTAAGKSNHGQADRGRATATAPQPTTVAACQAEMPPGRRHKWLLAAAIALEAIWIAFLVLLAIQH